MSDKDQEFMEHLRATFRVEADEHLRSISSGLIEMEKTDTPGRQQEVIETVFREAHSLKGAARSVKFVDIEAFCQAMESLFAALKSGEVRLTAELFDLLHQSTDFLSQLLSAAAHEQSAEQAGKQLELIRMLKESVKGKAAGEGEEANATAQPQQESVALGDEVKASPSTPSGQSPPHHADPLPAGVLHPQPLLADTVRVSTAKLAAVLLQSEEMLSAKLAATQLIAQMRETTGAFRLWKKEWSRVLPDLQKVKVPLDKMVPGTGEHTSAGAGRELAKILEFLEWNENFITELASRHAAELKTAKHDSLSLGGMVNNLLDEMKKVLMFPFSSLLESFPKIVRDLSRDYGKSVELVIRGGELEIDRRILEEMKDPLVHMVRNCIDHGIGKPAERKVKNKPEQGTISITVSPKDDKVEVIVADDGAGISLDMVRSALLKLDMLPREKVVEMSGRELLPYIFQSGVSTSPIITELSGRGLGLAIAREKVEKLGGTISIETEADAGTRFRMVIPLTVATFRGILVRVGERTFVVPTMHVVRAERLKQDEIKTVENRETIQMNGQALSLARLADVLEISPGAGGADGAGFLSAVVLSAAGVSIAFLVDEVLGEQEVLLKCFGRQLSRVRNVAGATVLGNGRLVPILNVPDLLKSAVKLSTTALLPGSAAAAGDVVARKQSVLVVEDSITTRTLLQNILEAVGYDVVTAVDGVDAFTRLKSGELVFDIVVSDVEMPRMNGFDLTARIRADKKLGELPVVLVTALESREDRERGIDVGANAYIVKSSFDQSNLLEVIRRLA
jgi:two-component system chemotaxis sensor kinase CheA